MNSVPFKQFIPGIAWFFVILILISMPGEDIPQPKGWWEWVNLIHIDKIVHMGIFAVQVFLFNLAFARSAMNRPQKARIFLWVTAAAIGWGLGTELIQRYFIESRTFDLVDWTADSIGCLAGLLSSRWLLLNRFAYLQKPALA
jgi:hypothetical protein